MVISEKFYTTESFKPLHFPEAPEALAYMK